MFISFWNENWFYPFPGQHPKIQQVFPNASFDATHIVWDNSMLTSNIQRQIYHAVGVLLLSPDVDYQYLQLTGAER